VTRAVAFVALALAACAGPAGSQGTLASPNAAGVAVDAGAAIVDAAPAPDATPPPPPPAPEGYLKGQLHLHTKMSGDSDTPPNQVARFYAEHGYDFIVITDHNHVTELLPREGQMLVIPGVEFTHSTTACDPPPEKKKCLVHVNGLFVDTPPPIELPVAPVASTKRLALYLRFVDAARALGGLPMLNHPNFAWTADAALVAEVGRHGVRLVEVFNQGMPISNPGDATHPSSEALWDTVLSEGVTMWGVASDDAHHYYDVARVRAGLVEDAGVEEGGAGQASDAGVAPALDAGPGPDAGVPTVYPGDLGWVMVHAERDPKAIRAALERGDFYASTGVTLAAVVAEKDALVVDVAGAGPYHLECLGQGGRLVGDARGTHVRCERPADSRYVRVRVTDAHGRHAWTQPLVRQP
jgi:hypothetical protein